MTKAIWKGNIIAESDECIDVEGNQYFPPDSVDKKFLKQSTTTSVCPWKGLASYYDIVVDGDVNKDAAWYYPQPNDAAKEIKGYVAFWKGIEVLD
ncbi:DUF427 domain-containing protein [Candidatus Woesearchaeota archaeon]|nr:DUF427 domain-containing protein [Candidatus Woesearchaeota archaeon]